MRGNRIAQEIEALTRELSRPRYLRITATILIHETQKGARCICCGSRTSAIVERSPAGELVIDLELGDRFAETDVDAQAWIDLCQLAKHHEIPIRCSRAQLPFLLDPTGRHLFASGAQRSGKTTCGLYWLALQWIRRGGFGRRFWLVSSILPKAFELLKKLFLGDADSPPVLPRSLVSQMPRTHRASDTTTVLLDGSIISLKYFDGDTGAERLKSDPIIAALIDEAAHLPGEDSLTALRGRCQDHAGRLFFSSTARPESFLKGSIVDPAQEFERLPDTDPKKISGHHEGARYLYTEYPITENPWLDQDAVKAELATLDLSRPAVQRDYFGKWVGSTGPFWLDYDVDRHTFVHESRDFGKFGTTLIGKLGLSNQVDITARVVSQIFHGRNPHYRAIQATNKRYLLGTDVNINPMSTVVLQISGDRDAPEDRDKWHYWILDVIRTSGHSSKHIATVGSTFYGKILEPGKSGVFDGCGVVVDAKSVGGGGRDHTTTRYGGDPRGLAEAYGNAGMDLRAPEYKQTEKGPSPVPPGRWDSFASVVRLLQENRIHVAQRCWPIQEAFERQQDAGNGNEPMKNDPLDSAMDGMRYAIWAALHARVRETFDRLA